MIAQTLRYLAGVLHVAFNPKSKGFNSLQQQKAVKRRQSCTSVSLTDGSATRDVSRVAIVLNVHHTVIGNFRLVQHVEALRIFAPGKLSTIHDHSTQRRTVPSHELGHGMYDDIGAVFDRPQQDWRGNCVIDNQRNAVFVGDPSKSFDVRDIARWITYAFAKDRPGVFVDQLFHILRTVTGCEARRDSALRENMRQKSIGGAI